MINVATEVFDMSPDKISSHSSMDSSSSVKPSKNDLVNVKMKLNRPPSLIPDALNFNRITPVEDELTSRHFDNGTIFDATKYQSL